MYLRLRSYTFMSLIFFLCLASCKPSPERPTSLWDAGEYIPPGSPLPALPVKATDVLDNLKSGDVVLRSGIGPDSYILSKLNQKDRTYSHCGVVMIEDGYPFVYHSIGGEDNPDERLRRDSADIFFTPKYCRGLAVVRYDYDSVHIEKLRAVVRGYYSVRPRFDMRFDLATDSALYCSEFVCKAINKSMDDTGYIKTSFAYGRRFVGIDDLFMNPHSRIVWKVAY
ncbi:hypothetical protein CJD36_010330 [Flavipsychrobacter stenotrophus]|uniref:Permuted papain-like amidase YaeF/Yiix C92 family enzyme n=1 Tax=Flavipsychrobacter stenotrophus TaxID=2077091 RepID=A0A2S7SUT4_9BACT|nr:hypothetical protein [Flavipsychrobacter stenotrophus]PQJ10365.1 hypothetical protein CJD36_010330 [Flavipsychrobacter stenotrophus]